MIIAPSQESTTGDLKGTTRNNITTTLPSIILTTLPPTLQTRFRTLVIVAIATIFICMLMYLPTGYIGYRIFGVGVCVCFLDRAINFDCVSDANVVVSMCVY